MTLVVTSGSGCAEPEDSDDSGWCGGVEPDPPEGLTVELGTPVVFSWEGDGVEELYVFSLDADGDAAQDALMWWVFALDQHGIESPLAYGEQREAMTELDRPLELKLGRTYEVTAARPRRCNDASLTGPEDRSSVEFSL